MPYRELNDAIQKLERLASDDGSWRPLMDEAPELLARAADTTFEGGDAFLER